MNDQSKKNEIVEESSVPTQPAPVEGGDALQLKVRRIRISTNTKGGAVMGPGPGTHW